MSAPMSAPTSLLTVRAIPLTAPVLHAIRALQALKVFALRDALCRQAVGLPKAPVTPGMTSGWYGQVLAYFEAIPAAALPLPRDAFTLDALLVTELPGAALRSAPDYLAARFTLELRTEGGVVVQAPDRPEGARGGTVPLLCAGAPCEGPRFHAATPGTPAVAPAAIRAA